MRNAAAPLAVIVSAGARIDVARSRTLPARLIPSSCRKATVTRGWRAPAAPNRCHQRRDSPPWTVSVSPRTSRVTVAAPRDGRSTVAPSVVPSTSVTSTLPSTASR